MPEQLQLHSTRPTIAALIDIWGRPHRLDPLTLIGRQVDGHGLAILEPSVSRHHAHLTLDHDEWSVRDLGSANGTFHDDMLIASPVTVHEGSRLRFGHIAFYFVGDVARLPMPQLGRTMTATINPAGRRADSVPAREPLDELPRRDEERTEIGLPIISFKLHEPTGGGGGLIEIDGKQVQLTMTQFELMALMIKRMASELHQPELVRGFVRSSELIADLSWDTHEPSENHVKQLVRRVRRVLLKSEVGDLIESRHRFGYRLRAIPRDDGSG
ncbi:MAG TPA: FHA domain-containing protein [Kofleriaceae bacterium]|jgi:pSer/pThr/pTyr-binding forkhead associated (FHA) protein|nr:FHA domain-containing protein [Kofleriaceae bacterium]